MNRPRRYAPGRSFSLPFASLILPYSNTPTRGFSGSPFLHVACFVPGGTGILPVYVPQITARRPTRCLGLCRPVAPSPSHPVTRIPRHSDTRSFLWPGTAPSGPMPPSHDHSRSRLSKPSFPGARAPLAADFGPFFDVFRFLGSKPPEEATEGSPGWSPSIRPATRWRHYSGQAPRNPGDKGANPPLSLRLISLHLRPMPLCAAPPVGEAWDDMQKRGECVGLLCSSRSHGCASLRSTVG
jgi:hypothetical protein